MSDGIGSGLLSLQSGFVVAALIAAILLTDRLGGDEALARRGIQVVLGVAIALAVVAGTTAFIRLPEAPEGDVLSFSGEDQEARDQREEFTYETAERTSEAGSIHIGVGILLVALGAILMQRLRAIPLALLLGGALLLLLGGRGGSGTSSDSISAFYGLLLAGESGQTRDIVRFIVLLAGTMLLLELAWWRWERLKPEPVVAVEPAAEP